jgi:decaprenylphospho-beta-D-erythro-pentofuranosid-2-ulose 2-reductase
MLDTAQSTLHGLDTDLIAHSSLPDQNAGQQSIYSTMEDLQTNALSVIALLTEVANRFERQRRGSIAVTYSVAGDRGRQSDYLRQRQGHGNGVRFRLTAKTP